MSDKDLLGQAVWDNNILLVEELLDKGVNPDLVDHFDKSLLMTASEEGFFDIVQLLLDHGANVNIRLVVLGYTALGYACENGHVEIVKLLLSHGAKPNEKYNNGSSPFLRAKVNKHNQIAKILKSSSAKSSGCLLTILIPLLMFSILYFA